MDNVRLSRLVVLTSLIFVLVSGCTTQQNRPQAATNGGSQSSASRNEGTAGVQPIPRGYVDSGSAEKFVQNYMPSQHHEVADPAKPESDVDQTSPQPRNEIQRNSSDSLATTQLWVDSSPSGATILIAPSRNGEYKPWKYGDLELTTPARAWGPAVRECWVKVRKKGFADSEPEHVANVATSPVRLVFKLIPLDENAVNQRTNSN